MPIRKFNNISICKNKKGRSTQVYVGNYKKYNLRRKINNNKYVENREVTN